jgi:hypothetical protein
VADETLAEQRERLLAAVRAVVAAAPPLEHDARVASQLRRLEELLAALGGTRKPRAERVGGSSE